MKPAFSTVACPEWTLDQVAHHAEKWGFLGVELRTFGSGSSTLACDPALTSALKTRTMFRRAGVTICSLATGVRFDDPITPPLLGQLLDHEQTVREGKSAVDLAVQLECPLVRVFGFELNGHERRTSAIARIAERLGKVADHCRNSGVRLVLENGGSFGRSADIAEIIDKVNSPMLAAAYSPAVAATSNESPNAGLNVLGDRMLMAKFKDFRDGVPCALGDGDLHAREAAMALVKGGFGGWGVYEYDRLWFREAGDIDQVMSKSAKSLFEWSGKGVRAGAM
ncbi:MAG: TIM barrel protein [Phycisphaerales bacterium]|jgi:sugar phosphate isomerase/epimerase